MNRPCWALGMLFLLPSLLQCQDAYQRGLEALGRRDTAAAMAAFDEAMNSPSRKTDAARQLARLSYQAGNMGATTKHLDQLLAMEEDDVEALKLYGDVMVRSSRAVEATAYYRRASLLAPDNPGISLSLGKALLAADSADAAIVHLSIARIHAPKNAEVYEALGDAYARIGVAQMAVTDYKEALRLDKKNTRLRMKVAELLVDNRKYNEAADMFRSIHAIDTSYAEAYLEEATLYCRAEMYKNALPSLRTYRTLRPRSVAADSLYAIALTETRSNAEAVRFFRQKLARDSSSVEYWRMYAHALHGMREYGKSVNAFAALNRRGSLTAEDNRLLAQAYARLGKDQDAIAAFEEAIAADTAACDPFYDLGTLYMKQKEYGKAADMFERRIRCDSSSVGAYLNAGSCCLAMAGSAGDRSASLARARELLALALHRAPDYLPTHHRMAQYYALVDSFDLAKEEYEAVLKEAAKDPKRYRKEAAESHGQIAMYYSYRKEPQRALPSFRTAHSLGYENATMQFNWGLAYLQTVDPQKPEQENRVTTESAVSHFRRATALDPNNAQAHFWLGAGLIRLRIPGNDASIRSLTAEACKEFRTALRLAPENEDVKKEMTRYGCK